VLDRNNGQFAFQVPIKAFTFKNALMQEHFNESYLESDVYPKAVFKGKVLGWNNIELSKDSLEVFIEGDLTMHGETNQIKQSGAMWLSSGSIRGECVFNVNLVDYNVKVPKIVRENIAEIIKVNVSVELKKK
jgi:archaellum component FlaG (FlaF/FlaG flagellin family)